MTRPSRTGKMRPSEASLTQSGHDVTAFLHAWTEGDVAARHRLMAVVYRELRRRAAVYLRRERRDRTFRGTLPRGSRARLVVQGTRRRAA